jgi:hypothetical protein
MLPPKQQRNIDDMRYILFPSEAFSVGIVFIQRQPQKGIGLLFQYNIFVQSADIDLQDEILMVVGQAGGFQNQTLLTMSILSPKKVSSPL